ncbi:MAG: radical SAM protein [Spirochaetales bacterium]|nr:radical SAM protein [Spirochaetales bacterium]
MSFLDGFSRRRGERSGGSGGAFVSGAAEAARSAGRRELAAGLDWIRDFWRSLAPYAYVRAEDQVVILPPNLVYRTNATGVALVDFVERGGRFEDIPGFGPERAAEIERFFREIAAAHRGEDAALATVPYDFSFTKLPVLGEIAVTYRCNNACRFCYAGCDGAPACPGKAGPSGLPGGELDTAGMKRVIDVFRDEAKIPFFSFTGGEPLLRGDLEELAAYAVSRGLRVNLITNGTLASPERARSLFESGLRTAQVSLEAPDAQTHDDLCGRRGAFDETVAGIEALRAAGVEVQTNSTLTSLNREALLDLPAFVAGLGVRRLSMNLFIPAGTGERERALLVPYSEAGAFVDAARDAARKAGLRFLWYSPIPLCHYNPIARGLGNKSCAACDGLVSVSPSGEILPCSSWPESVGPILDGRFAASWFSERAAWIKAKRFAPESCRSCDSFVACQGACPLYWRVVGTAEIEGRARRAVRGGT